MLCFRSCCPTATSTGQQKATASGVEAVASCDLVVVPAVAVDQRGTRLGRGGGSYDRVLARVRCLTIAVLYDGEHLAMLPSEPHDVPVAAVVTPAKGVTTVGVGARRQ